MACLCIPFGFVSNLLLQYWPFGAIMCVVVSYSQAVSVFISAYTLIAISIDRYIAILYPLRPRMSKLHAKLIIGSVWLVAILTPLPTALLSQLTQPVAWAEVNSTKYICTEEWSDYTYRYYYSMALMVLQYFFPLTVLVYTYTRIAIVVWGKRTPGEAEDSRDRRMAASKRKVGQALTYLNINYPVVHTRKRKTKTKLAVLPTIANPKRSSFELCTSFTDSCALQRSTFNAESRRDRFLASYSSAFLHFSTKFIFSLREN